MEWRQLTKEVLRHRLVSLCAFLVCLLVGAAAAYLPQKTYTATATVAVAPTTAADGAGVQAATFLLPTFVAEVSTPGFHSSVQAALPAEIEGQPTVLTASNTAGTGIIKVMAKSSDPAGAAAWATAAAQSLVAAEHGFAKELSLTVLQPASIPTAPSFPQPFPIMLGALVLGIIVAPTAASVRARSRRTADMAGEIPRRLGLPLLAEVPRTPALRRLGGSLLPVLSEGPPEFPELLRHLRTNLELVSERKTGPVAVASLSRGEGKSVIAAALACSYAALGREVAVVDADLRRPSQHRLLDEPFGDGLAEVVAGGMLTVRPTSVPHLGVVMAGRPTGHPADVIAMALPSALSALGDSGTLVVIDCPPVRVTAEAAFVLANASQVILVIGRSTLQSETLEQTVTQLRARGVKFAGVVLNRVRRRRAVSGTGYLRKPVSATPQLIPALGQREAGPKYGEDPPAPADRASTLGETAEGATLVLRPPKQQDW